MSQKIEILKVVHKKLESKRDELMDKINATLSSNLKNRVEIVYKTELKLVAVEKAIELNRFFMIQTQQEVLSDLISNDIKEVENNSDEEKTKKTEQEK